MKITIKILLLLCLLFSFNLSFAEDARTIKITVTEPIPWANCAETTNTSAEWPVKPKIVCEVPVWWTAALGIMWQIIRWFTAVAMIVWVLFIVLNWIYLSMWGVDSWAKEAVKKRIMMALGWLILLLLSWPLLSLIAPWVYN